MFKSEYGVILSDLCLVCRQAVMLMALFSHATLLMLCLIEVWYPNKKRYDCYDSPKKARLHNFGIPGIDISWLHPSWNSDFITVSPCSFFKYRVSGSRPLKFVF
jgi:hypothetical protein